MSEKVVFRCKCGQKLSVSSGRIGEQFECPNCKTFSLVPFIDLSEPPHSKKVPVESCSEPSTESGAETAIGSILNDVVKKVSSIALDDTMERRRSLTRSAVNNLKGIVLMLIILCSGLAFFGTIASVWVSVSGSDYLLAGICLIAVPVISFLALTFIWSLLHISLGCAGLLCDIHEMMEFDNHKNEV